MRTESVAVDDLPALFLLPQVLLSSTNLSPCASWIHILFSVMDDLLQ